MYGTSSRPDLEKNILLSICRKNKVMQTTVLFETNLVLLQKVTSRKEALNFENPLLLLPRLEAVRCLCFATHKNITIFQMDVKTAFLNGPLKKEVYVSQPDGFVNPDFPYHVYRLKNALYGLKQAPRAWASRGLRLDFEK
ncbi:retrovirus-related pol polyprotein from transposon TNT 1-94 [Tanacetum coccineum]